MPKITFETFLMNGFICRKVCKMHYFSAKTAFFERKQKKMPEKFGAYSKKLYLCTRNQETNTDNG